MNKTKKSKPTVREEVQAVVPTTPKNNVLNKVFIGLLIVLIIGGLGFTFKDKWLDKVVVAMVNGQPVLRTELDQRLASTYGKETLENLIIEKLIADEAAKNKISVSEKDIDGEVAAISESLGEGTKIEDVLAMQGMTTQSFRDQMKLKIQVDKILEKDITITDAEITQYLKDNASTLIATDEAAKKEEAKTALHDQKINEKVQGWIGDLLANGKITRFLK